MTQEQPKMTIELAMQDVNFILESLGERKASTNAYALMMEIKRQCDPQVPDDLKPKE
jgi:hypothetical protein